MLEEGWYLMSAGELEAELPYLNDPAIDGPVSGAIRLDRDAALASKVAGNVPDPEGRWLRLVLRAEGHDPEAIARRRVEFEPDYHEAPKWRRPGSKPINVIPLRSRTGDRESQAWWEDPAMEALESEWQEHGTVAGVSVPGAYRSFVFKTVAALRAAGRPVSADSIADSIARWVSPEDAEKIRGALLQRKF